MNKIQDFAEILLASWILSGNAERMPTSHGVLDRALEMAIKRGAFQTWSDRLHFVDSRVGLRCVELPAILDWAQRAQLSTAPNPSYHYTQLQMSETVARSILDDLQVDEDIARKWGQVLADSIKAAQASLQDFEVEIEEY